MSDFPFKVGDSVGRYDLKVEWPNSVSEELISVSVVSEILKERIVVVNYERYAEINGVYRQFTNEGYCRSIIRPLDVEGKITAEAVLAEQKRQREMRYEIDLLVQLHRETNTQAFLEHVKVFRGV